MKPIDYWTDTKKPRNLATLTPQERLELLETLKHMEAKEWITRFLRQSKKLGQKGASIWWLQTFQDIEKRRGTKAANELRWRMNNIKGNK